MRLEVMMTPPMFQNLLLENIRQKVFLRSSASAQVQYLGLSSREFQDLHTKLAVFTAVGSDER